MLDNKSPKETCCLMFNPYVYKICDNIAKPNNIPNTYIDIGTQKTAQEFYYR